MLEDPLCEEPEIGLLAGASYWRGMCIEHILGSTCGGCGKRREEKEGQYLLWVPKERLDMLWVPLADHCGGLRDVLAPASYGHMWYLGFVGLFVHASYPL